MPQPRNCLCCDTPIPVSNSKCPNCGWDDFDGEQEADIRQSRAINWSKVDDLGYEYLQYFGPDDAVTKPLCRILVGKVWSVSEIHAIDNGEDGPGTAHIACGGTGCRHRWVPVREEYMDPDEWSELRGSFDQLVDAGFVDHTLR